MLATKKYVGRANTRPASRTPRRLTYAIKTTRACGDPHGSVVGREHGEHRRQRRHACRDRNGDRQGVVDQQRHDRDLRDSRPEILSRDHVGAASLRVDLHDLEVRQGHEEQDAR